VPDARPVSPAQWRVLLYLYQHKLHTVRPYARAVRKSQDAGIVDLDDLYGLELIGAQLGNRDIEELGLRGLREAGLAKLLSSSFAKSVRLRLTAAGLRVALADAGNQIRYALGNGARTLAGLFDDNEIELEDVAEQQRRGLITITLPDGDDFDLTDSMDMLTFRLGFLLKVKLTAKGKEYLPR
jgi:hypothetical protein